MLSRSILSRYIHELYETDCSYQRLFTALQTGSTTKAYGQVLRDSERSFAIRTISLRAKRTSGYTLRRIEESDPFLPLAGRVDLSSPDDRFDFLELHCPQEVQPCFSTPSIRSEIA